MESHDYEHYRNLTLMFFFEKLLEKGGPRTLHDLSCQFGTKGFSKEMRQIAGGSQSGLRKFLQQYPSLFTVDGEWVSITQTIKVAGDGGGGPGDRDYVNEAVDYFKNKLRQYGAGTEVPIKSLLGHRSQAPPEVRHISGQHVKEFKDFLARYPEEFVVKEEIVFLKEYEGKITSTFREPDEYKVDPVVTNQFLQFFRETVDSKGPLHVDQLFELTSNHFNVDLWSTLFKTPQDLCTFLKIYAHLFHVQANIITLVPQKTYAPVMINSTPAVPRYNVSSPQNQNIIPPPRKEPLSPKHSGGSSNGSSSPVTNKIDSPRDNPMSLNQQTLKQRVNMVVMRMIAQNSDHDQRAGNIMNTRTADGDPQKMVNHSQFNQQQYQQQQQYQPQLMQQQQPPESREALKYKVLQVSRVVVSVRESSQLVDDLLRAGQPVGFDGEGVNLGPKGQLTLVQISTFNGQVIIFDVQTTPAIMTQGGLKRLLESEHIIKVVHDCRNDSAALYFQCDVQVRNVFDTQAAHAVLQLQDTGKPVYKVKNVSLNALCELYNAPVNPMKEQVKNIYRRDQKFWARRPLTRDMICYAAADVLALVPTIYNCMASQVKPEFGNLFRELCEEQVLLYIQAEEVKNRKKQRKVETEVADLRLKLATVQSKNIVLSNREIRLLRYIELTEDDKEKLKGSYKVAKKLEKLENRDSRTGLDSDEDDDYECDTGDYPSLDSLGSGPTSETSPASPDSSLSPRPLGSPGGPNTPRSTNSPSTGPVSLAESMQLVDEILANGSMDRMDRIEKLESILSAACLEQVDNRDVGRSKGTNPNMVDAETQTLSTGDIVITKVYFPDGQAPSSQDSTPQNSPKKGFKMQA
jgi:exonuclease 3'-5' domain-containing protein 1